jgi:hypothetical protein
VLSFIFLLYLLKLILNKFVKSLLNFPSSFLLWYLYDCIPTYDDDDVDDDDGGYAASIDHPE